MHYPKLPALLLTLTSCFAQWPSPRSAMDAYDFVQARRSEAQKLWTQGDARGFAILNDALAYLEQPLVKDLAAGNRHLAARRSNIYYGFAAAYALQGKTRHPGASDCRGCPRGSRYGAGASRRVSESRHAIAVAGIYPFR
jgi:hypothetical protein